MELTTNIPELNFNIDKSDLFQLLIQKQINELEQKKQEVIIMKLRELNIEIDHENEQHRRFKRFAREIRGNEETIYYNDGSMSGLRIVTFKTIQEQTPFNSEKFSTTNTITYY